MVKENTTRKKCSDEDIIKAMLEAISKGKYFKTEKELAEFIQEVCGYSDKRLGAGYRRAKELIKSGLIGRDPKIGYYPKLDKEHYNLVHRTFPLILDLIEKGEVVLEENEKYYGQRLSRGQVESLIDAALEHILIAEPELQEVVKEFNKLVSDLSKIYECIEIEVSSIKVMIGFIIVAMNNILKVYEDTFEPEKKERHIIDYVVEFHEAVRIYEKLKELRKTLEEFLNPKYLEFKPTQLSGKISKDDRDDESKRLPEKVDLPEDYRKLIEEITAKLEAEAEEKLACMVNGLTDDSINKARNKMEHLLDLWRELSRKISIKVNSLLHIIKEFSLGEPKTPFPGACEYCSIGKFLIRDFKWFEELKCLVKELKRNLYEWIRLRPLVTVESPFDRKT